MRGNDFVDHIQGEDGDDTEVEEKGGLGGITEDFIDRLDFFIRWSVEDDNQGSDLGPSQLYPCFARTMYLWGKTDGRRGGLTIQDAQPHTPNLPNFSSSKNDAKMALSRVSSRLCDPNKRFRSLGEMNIPNDNTHGS